MYVMSLNVRKDLPPAKALEDIKRAESLAGVILWQEIEKAATKDALVSLNKAEWQTVGQTFDAPISFKTDTWELVAWGHSQISDGREHVSPNHYLIWAELRRVGTDYTVTFCNAHMINGSTKPDKYPDSIDFRREQWAAGFAAFDRQVEAWHKAGRTIVGGGDYNKTHVEKFVSSEEWLSPVTGYDYLWCIEGASGPTVEVQGEDTVSGGWNTDHPARRAHLIFHPRDVKPTPPTPTPPAPPEPVDVDSLSAALAVVEKSLGREPNPAAPILQRIEALAK